MERRRKENRKSEDIKELMEKWGLEYEAAAERLERTLKADGAYNIEDAIEELQADREKIVAQLHAKLFVL